MIDLPYKKGDEVRVVVKDWTEAGFYNDDMRKYDRSVFVVDTIRTGGETILKDRCGDETNIGNWVWMSRDLELHKELIRTARGMVKI